MQILQASNPRPHVKVLAVRHSIPGDARPPGAREPTQIARFYRHASRTRCVATSTGLRPSAIDERAEPQFQEALDHIRPSMAVPSAAMPKSHSRRRGTQEKSIRDQLGVPQRADQLSLRVTVPATAMWPILGNT